MRAPRIDQRTGSRYLGNWTRSLLATVPLFRQGGYTATQMDCPLSAELARSRQCVLRSLQFIQPMIQIRDEDNFGIPDANLFS
jgi:hypothetical protein